MVVEIGRMPGSTQALWLELLGFFRGNGKHGRKDVIYLETREKRSKQPAHYLQEHS